MDYTLIPSSDILNDYITRYHPDGESIDESLFRAIADDTIYKIIGNQTKLFGIVIIDIKNFTGQLPKNYSSDIQAVFRLKPEKYRRVEITQMIQDIPGNECKLEINLKCPACHREHCSCGDVIAQVNVDRIWRMANPEYIAAASKFYTDSFNPLSDNLHHLHEDSRFKLMKRTTDNWFSIRYYVGDCVRLLPTMAIEYKIVNGKVITNFEEGQVMMAYLGDHLGEDGYKLVPNNPRAIEAVMSAFKHILMERRFLIQLDQNSRMALQMLTQEMEIKIQRARTELNFPEYNEFIAAIQGDWRKMYNPQYWHNGGRARPDHYNPSNDYNFIV